MLKTNWLRRNGYPRYSTNDMGQRLRNEGLTDYVGGVAKGAIRVGRLSVGVHVPDLHDGGANDKCATEKAKDHPEGMMGFPVGAATWHC